MVTTERSRFSSLLIEFRRRAPWQQAAIVGSAFFIFYLGYSYFLLRFPVLESFYAAVTASVLFASVYFLTSLLIMRMESKVQRQNQGPKKGKRK
ncbi:MAG: hypothetical protein HPY61_00780 [Methanotrichaceae archaeon]|nr:hypothetical protein [Methanotrichaceae archaeon]